MVEQCVYGGCFVVADIFCLPWTCMKQDSFIHYSTFTPFTEGLMEGTETWQNVREGEVTRGLVQFEKVSSARNTDPYSSESLPYTVKLQKAET